MKSRKIFNFFFYSFFILTIGWVNLFFYSPLLAQSRGQNLSDFRSGELLVKFRDDPEVHLIKVEEGTNILEIIKKYEGFKEIDYLEPNYLFKTAAFPNDPKYFEQWYLKAINASQAWSKDLLVREQEKNNNKSIIAILDTGVDLDHPDLKEKIWVNTKEIVNNKIDDDRNGYVDDVNGWDFISEDSDPNPSFDTNYNEDALNHGTIVSGIAAAVSNNQEGIAGLSWFSQIMPLRVLDSQGQGDTYNVVRAIDYAIAKGANVINMSFVGSSYSFSLAEAIRRAYDQDILLVAAAGNTDPKVNGFDLDVVKIYPVCYDGSADQNMVVGVASLDRNLKKSVFSNYGSCIDVAVPGESFYSTQVYNPLYADFNKYYDGYWSGTSLSAPLVSGTFGLIKALRPDFSAQEIKDFVLENTKNIDGYNAEYKGKLGSGQLDVLHALESALSEESGKAKMTKNNYIVAGLGLGSFPQLKILKQDGTVFKAFYAYNPLFKGAINVAAGDVNGDGKEEIITAAGAGGGPHIRIFNIEGYVLSQFFAYDKSFRGGVTIAVADINGDGKDEIITGIGKGGEPEVKIFDFEGNLLNKFLAYEKGFYGGVKVAVGDINGDSKNEIVTGAGAGGGPHVRVFDGEGKLISQFFAYNKNFKGGINVAVGDLQGNSQAEIIASIEKDSVPTVRTFNYQGVRLTEFFAYEANFWQGVNVSTGDIDNDGVDEIITGQGIGGGPQVKIFNLEGRLKLEITAHTLSYQGGVRPAVLKD